MSAEALVREAVESQYELAYSRFARDVFRFVLAWTNDWSEAEDLTQETYLRLWRHRQTVDWDRPIVPWLMVTARRLASNRARSLRRRISPPTRESRLDESARARWLDVCQAIGTLTALERSALILTTVEGWSYAEVAKILETTDGALRAAVSRARDKLEVG